MSPRVAPEQRRRELADAVWRVVRREGLERASVRAVAAEAALSMGSLRHYFTRQSELHTFAMRLVMQSIEERVSGLQSTGDVLRDVGAVLRQFLPLDEQRRAESEVWMAFTARALIDPELGALRDEAYDALAAVCRQSVVRLSDGSWPVARITLEAERLYALLDGLLLHGVVRPERMDATLMLDVLEGHLAGLRGRG